MNSDLSASVPTEGRSGADRWLLFAAALYIVNYLGWACYFIFKAVTYG